VEGPVLKEDVFGVWKILEGCIEENIEVLVAGCPKDEVDAEEQII
jgi:hypothetical protein